MLAPSGVFMGILLFVLGGEIVLDPDPVAVLAYVFGEMCQLVLQIRDTTDQGLHVRPVILPVPLSLQFHSIDVFVEDLPRGIYIRISSRVPPIRH